MTNKKQNSFTNPSGFVDQTAEYLQTDAVRNKMTDKEAEKFYRRGGQQFFGKRASTLYGPEGGRKGLWAGAGIGALTAIMGRKFKLKNPFGKVTPRTPPPTTPVRSGGLEISPRRPIDMPQPAPLRGALGIKDPKALKDWGTEAARIGGMAAAGSVVGGGAGIIDPEAGMGLEYAAYGLATGMVGTKIARAVQGRQRANWVSGRRAAGSPSQRRQSGVGGTRSTISGFNRLNKPYHMSSTQANYTAAGIAGAAGVAASNFYQYHADRFERGKGQGSDPYFGTARTTPGIRWAGLGY